ncbi:hypothetical protein [Vibrio cincinnatiensis]|uniref:hypothetical protein n=1 Tax=Vibrio cincinnatiensis TaxID=675 RepID=UPI001EE04268|nr:hypothetical protein [Vibrio cincinnatiensis]MCG3741178.1 hypothetical protein [Vibrio cincinnatiensis]
MGRSVVIQASIKGKLEEDFRSYQAQKNLNDADTARELMSFALRILLKESDESKPSNRELLEEIYRSVRCSSAMVDVTYAQTFNERHAIDNREVTTEKRNQIKADINNRVDDFLGGEKKE